MAPEHPDPTHLSRRERQIMDAIYAHGTATALQIHSALPDPPSYTAVRTLLGILERKGHLRHHRNGARYVYAPTHPRKRVAKSALRKVVETFFGGSARDAVAALIDSRDQPLSQKDLDELSDVIRKARKEGH